MDLPRVGKAITEPGQVGGLAGNLFGALALDLGLRTGLSVDTEVRIIVVGTLHVERDVHDRAVLPPRVFHVLGVLACQRELVLAKAEPRREEQFTLVLQTFDRVCGLRREGPGSIAAPAIRPVVVTGHHDQRLLEGTEIGERREIHVGVGAGAIAASLEVAVKDRECDVRGVDVRDQVWKLCLSDLVVGHVAEQRDGVL